MNEAVTKPGSVQPSLEDIFIHLMAHSPAAVSKLDAQGNVVGTGPFRVVDFGMERIVLERHPTYWRKEQPLLDRVDLVVEKGEQVTRGQTLGHLGETGARAPSLYFELRDGGKPVDPLGWLRAR